MVKKVLDELKWHPKKSLEGIEITYVHRGAPGDELTIPAEDIIRFEKSFFVIDRAGRETLIPYHRIKEIKKAGEVLWRKRIGEGS
ncbi:MAG: RNA repair domain-containing protein [Candidatus Hydrothermarchaeaceae archaeon]